MKTNVILKVRHDGLEYKCRVKLDQNKFPYIVVNNEKLIITDAPFPRKVQTVYGFLEVEVDLVAGGEELAEIQTNPDLASDKVSLKQQMRII